ncbi:hypothetical protein QYF61_011795 [Mycteria americana]|uniref:Uncharacterized protein n=1 Tax=Mycteria americana TaxID=33587 RepID=A0AAN7NEM3_MYCAM|nr:hypothetical protein QYF61_011795 [Mycteria americana]
MRGEGKSVRNSPVTPRAGQEGGGAPERVEEFRMKAGGQPFLYMVLTLAFFQSSGTSPDLHDFSKTMESGLATTSASSLNTLRFKEASLHLLQAQPKNVEEPQLSQPFFIGEVFQPSDHFCGPPLDPLQQVHVFPVLRAPELDTVLQVGSHQSRVEGQNHLLQPAGHAAFDAAQDMVGFLGCECTLLAHVQLFIHQYPQVLLCRAALNPFIPQPLLIPGLAPTKLQDLALGLVEPHEVHTGPLLKIVQVPLDGIPSLRRVNHTTQVGVVCRLAEGALDPSVYVIDEDIKQYWSQYGPLRDIACHQSPSGH